MRIVHVCLGGPVTDNWNYQDNLLTKFHKKDGHEVTLITSKWIYGNNGKLALDIRSEYVNDDGVNVIRLEIKGKNDFSRKFKKYSNLYETIKKSKPEILFIHGCQYVDIKNIVKYIKENPNVKIYVDNHADFSNSATNWISKNILHKIIWKRYARMIEPYTEKFYGVLPARVDFLIDVYGIDKNKVELLVMGADDDIIKEIESMENLKKSLRSKHNIDTDDFLIVTGGKIDLAKTQTILLMKAIRNMTNKKVKLIVFGSVADELKKEVEELVDNKNIYYIKWLNSKESYQYFSIADLVVFPGRHSVFWEQVAGIGIPMLVKYWNGTDHINKGGNCKFIKEDSLDCITKEIYRIVEDKELYNKMNFTAKNTAKTKFLYSNISKASIEN